jgi:hypothetical protein
MQRLSAFDAIGPAWNHTQALLFTPRSWRLVLKIGAVAFFAQMGGCNASFNTPTHGIGGINHLVLMSVLLAVSLVALAIYLVTFYIGSRLQFCLFEVVLRKDTWVGPIWRRYGAATWRWIGLKVLFGLAAMLCMAPILVPAILHFVHSMTADGNNSAADFGSLFAAILGFIAAIFFVILLISCVYALLADFGLPSMALEGTTLGETVRRVWGLVRAEPGQVLLYLLMRFILGFAGAIGSYIVLGLTAFVLLIPLGGAALVLWLSLQHAALGGKVLMVAGWAVLGIILLVLLFIAMMMVFGAVFAFIQAYALYFLGGRYGLVGQYLDPVPAPYYGSPGPAPPPKG